MRILYLHGFASGPQSSKAQFFARKFAECNITVDIPQLDGGDFENLTITGQLKIAEQAIGNGPVVVMGSSLGGYLAALLAANHPQRVERLVMMAPAFRFLERWRSRLTEEQLENWRNGGTLKLYHYGEKRDRALRYGLIDDAQHHAPEPSFTQPALILHGTKDEVVPVQGSQEFAKGKPNILLQTYTSGHELTDVLEPMWKAATGFLGLAPMVN